LAADGRRRVATQSNGLRARAELAQVDRDLKKLRAEVVALDTGRLTGSTIWSGNATEVQSGPA
jgi:hypothetical protein